MQLSRRLFLRLVTGAAAAPVLAGTAAAENYPTRPVRIIVGFPAGGTADLVPRLVGQWLSTRLEQPFIVENRPGGSGGLAAEATARAVPDGYTLLLAASSNAINATLYDRPKFNFIRDIAAVASICRNALVMEVHPSVPAKTVPEFIAYAKANPDKVNMASAGNGTPHHVAGELFQMMTGTNMLHVPYRGEGPALTDILTGRVQVMFTPIGASLEYIRSGRLRALAVTTASRIGALPETPTVGESVPGYEASGWFGLAAPRNIPADIIARLNMEVAAGLADPVLSARLVGLGLEPRSMTPDHFAQFIADDTEKWAKVVKFAGIQAD
jgi:tripartite-type tricarboxylate transporter receptor subunit TctC